MKSILTSLLVILGLSACSGKLIPSETTGTWQVTSVDESETAIYEFGPNSIVVKSNVGQMIKDLVVSWQSDEYPATILWEERGNKLNAGMLQVSLTVEGRIHIGEDLLSPVSSREVQSIYARQHRALQQGFLATLAPDTKILPLLIKDRHAYFPNHPGWTFAIKDSHPLNQHEQFEGKIVKETATATFGAGEIILRGIWREIRKDFKLPVKVSSQFYHVENVNEDGSITFSDNSDLSEMEIEPDLTVSRLTALLPDLKIYRAGYYDYIVQHRLNF